MTNFGKETKSKRILEQGKDQSLSDQTSQESNHGLERISSFKECKEVLLILLAQIGNARIRDMYKDRLMDYLNMQDAKVRQLGIRNHLLMNATKHQFDDHVQAMAELYDKHDITCPPHLHIDDEESTKKTG